MLSALSPSEIKFISDGVAQNVRSDGRGRFEFRPYTLETGIVSQTNGSAKLVIGKTHVLVGVKASLGEPSATAPEEGIVRVAVDCSPSANPSFEGQGAEDLNIKLAATVQDLFTSSNHMDLKSLCLMPKRQCWILTVDAMVLDAGGNLFDAISIAARAALANTTLPKARMMESGRTGEYVLELSEDPDECVRLSVDLLPIFISFHQIGQFSVVDPSSEEESCMGCRTTIGVNKAGKICAIDKGAGTLAINALAELTLAASKIGTNLITEIDQHLLKESTQQTQKTSFSRRLQ